MKATYSVSPVAEVSNENGSCKIIVKEEYRKALSGLDGFNYVNVVWWADQIDNEELRSLVEVDKPYAKSPDKLGIFATRSQIRPNPIAITPVMVQNLDIEKGEITIPFIDAENKTPVLDIKPYSACIDRIKNVTYPDWCDHWPKWYEESADFDWASEFTFEI